MTSLSDSLLAGNRRALARGLSIVERGGESAESLINTLYPHTGNAHIVGVTGAPGSGKSTLVTKLVGTMREKDLQIGVIAVDPSSPFTGGALLGDRVRMVELSGDPGIFIRSMASRGNLGGLAQGTASAVKLFDAAGFDIVIVETVGAGQAEVDIAKLAHTTLVVEAPGMGDDVQSIKAGILEIADILVVNKADHPAKGSIVKSLNFMLQLGQPVRQSVAEGLERWQVSVKETIAINGDGVLVLADEILHHQAFLRESGMWAVREADRVRFELENLLKARLLARIQQDISVEEQREIESAVVSRKLSPFAAVDAILEKVNQ